MYSSYSAAALALRAAKPSLHAHSSYSSYSYLPSHHCHRDDADEHRRRHHHHHELLQQSQYLAPRFLLDGCLLRHSAHLLLLSAGLRPAPPTHPHPPRCCRRRASASCCCVGSSVRPVAGQVSWQVEARGCRCCGHGAERPDLPAVCRRLEAGRCRRGGSGGGRLLGAGFGRRDAPRLVGRAVRQEVWEYEGGEWPRRRYLTECHDDWEDEEDCDRGQLEVVRLVRRRREDDDDDDVCRCRDCVRRKGLGSYYSGEDAYSGRRRERRDVDEDRRSFRDSDRRRGQQREYHDDEDDLDLRRQRQRWEGRDKRDFDFDDAVDTRSRRYRGDGREYDRRRERRDFDSDDTIDIRRASQHAEDVRKSDRRKGSRIEIDDKVDDRREGRRFSNDDYRYVLRHERSEDADGEDVSLLRSHRRNNEEIDYDEQDLAERRYYSGGRPQKSARATSFHEDDSKRASSSRSTVEARRARQEENSSSRVRLHDNVDRLTEQTYEERNQRHSVGRSKDERDTYDYDDARFVRVTDARTNTQDVKVITEDDSKLTSRSKNTSILKHSSNVDQQATVHKDESRKSSQKIMEISEVQDYRTEHGSSSQNYHQEDRGNYIENRSSSVQNSAKMASDCRRQVDQESLINVTTDSSHNVSSASHSQRNYDEVNQTDIDGRSTSLQNIIHITRDKKRIVNQQVIHETDIDVQNITHVDVSKIRASDTSTSRSSQSHSETKSDVNPTSNMSFINSTRSQEKEVYQNKISASNSAMVRGSQSHLGTGLYDQFHSTSSTNIADNRKESQEQVELNIANASNAVVASASGSHLQTRVDDQFQSTSDVNTIGSRKEQIDPAKIHASDATVVSSSQGLVTRNGNQVHTASAVHWPREKQVNNDKQITQVSSTERNDELGSKFSETSHDSRDRMVRSEDTHDNMDLIWQQADTSGISDDKGITGLLLESTGQGSSMVTADMAQGAEVMGRNGQEVRTETTAGIIMPSGSSSGQSVKESMLESAARLEKSSTFHVGRFVDELQKGVSDADNTTKNHEKSIVEGTTRPSSRSRMKGPADEMWDVHSTTSQETFKTADKEEGSSADGATNSASQTPKNESALARKVHRSLWAYVADIIRLGWIQRGDSHDSSDKSVKKSSSSNSQSTEGWLSSQERDTESTRKKNKAKDQQLIMSHSGESEPGVASMSKEEYFHSGTQELRISETVIEPKVRRSEGDLLAGSSKDDLHVSEERIKQSDVGESPEGNIIDDSTPTLIDVTIGHLPEHKTATSSRITTKGSGEFNTGKGMLAGSSSVTIGATEAGRSGDGADWIYNPSGVITPYRHPQTQAVVPHESTSTSIHEPPALPVGGIRFEEKNVVQEAPEIIKTGGKDAELKRRNFQRNKQVLKETFDEWEEAYQRDAEQRKADELFMREALLEAQRAADIWEVPVGAVLVQNGEIIARGCNLVEDLRDSTAHAEIVCIREASNKLKTWRLAETTLYVTLEPCAMCAGAILQARIDTVVWGAPNKLLGADGSWVRLFPGDGQTSTLDSANQSQSAGPIHPFHPKITIRRGVLSAECSEIMQQFFQLRRRKKQKAQSPPRAHHQGHPHPVKFFSSLSSHTEDAQRGSPQANSTTRVDTGQRLVDRMPINPKIAVFESTQERFEVPLRPDMRSSHGVVGGPESSVQIPPGPSVVRKTNLSHDCTRHLMEDGHARGRKKAACPVVEGVYRKKKPRSSCRYSKEKNKAPDNSRHLTDYFVTREGTEGPPLLKRSAKPSQSFNIRCNPSDLLFTIQLLNHDQYAAIEALGFGHLLMMQIDAVESSDLLTWIMDRVSPVDMIIRIGPGKVLPITPSVIHMVLGLPKGGSTIPSYSRMEDVQFRKQMISDLNQECLSDDDPIHISNLQEEILKGRVDSLFMRCFFMIVFNCLLFPTSSSNIDSSNISKAMNPELFSAVDLSQSVFDDLQASIRIWHGRNKEQFTHTIYGCAVFLIVLYLDNLHHSLSPPDWVSTPRVSLYNNATIHGLTIADMVQGRDGFRTYGSIMFKSRSSTCYGDVPVCKDGFDDMTSAHQICVPRMRDLLSRPLARLRGHTSETLLEALDQFDLTISENTSAIQSSVNNIVRAPIHLAEKLQPVIEELISAQTSLSGPNPIGEPSQSNNCGDEYDFVDTHTVFEDAPSVTRAPGTAHRHHINRGDFIPDFSHTGYAQGQYGDLSPVATPPHGSPDGNHPSHSIVGETSKSTEIAANEDACPSHVNNFSLDDAPPDGVPAFTNNVSGTLYGPQLRAGKRFTRKPDRFCSPFKYGVISRPPPSVNASLNLWGRLCADDSPYRSTTVIQFGTTPLTGALIAQSFSDAALADSIFMSFFVSCLIYDDYIIRPECYGYRIFLDAEVSAFLNVEWTKRDTPQPKYSQVAAVAAIQRLLPFTDLKKTKLILLPVMHQHHWSVYCVNFDQSRIDILDSMDHNFNCNSSWDMFHSHMGKKIMHRLSDALSNAAPHKFKSFKNWRHVQVQVPVQKDPSDSIFFAMKFLEFYDGEGHGALKTNFDTDRSRELRAETLYYITFHAENKVDLLPDDLLQFRQEDHHPYFY